jgi:hypothetical protein
MDNEQEPGHEAETPVQSADLVTMMERPRNQRPVFALASWTAERRAKDPAPAPEGHLDASAQYSARA